MLTAVGPAINRCGPDATLETEVPDTTETDNEDTVRGKVTRLLNTASDRRSLLLGSFLESTIIPVPLELIVGPLMIRRDANAFVIAFWILLGCTLGALLFYGLGAALFDPVVKPILESLGQFNGAEEIKNQIGEEGAFWTVFLISFSPAPLQLATLGAGIAQANILTFLLAIILSRGIRYFGFAAIMHFAGRPALSWIRRRQRHRKSGQQEANAS